MRALMRTIIVVSMLNSVATSSATVEKAEVEAGHAGVKADASAPRELVAESLTNVEPEIEQITKSIVLATTSQYSGAGRVLVIPTEETRGQDIITIMEDLNVMSRILDKRLEDADLGRDCDWFYGSSFLEWNMPVTKSIYIEDSGVLFLKQVDFPLSPPDKPKGGDKGAEDFDPVWEQTRREMYFGRNAWRQRHKKRSKEEYDAKKVEDLKMTLLQTLRHTANIRNLEPDKWIIVTVIGSGESGGFTVGTLKSKSAVIVHDQDTKTVRTVAAPSPGEAGFSSPTVLTIRAEKSDVDDFAEGNIDFDEFREKVQIFTY